MVPKINYYGLNHKTIDKYFEGGMTFCNSFCVNEEYQPVVVYKVAKPNKKKKHKKYLLLQISGTKLLVRGMSAQNMKKFRYQAALRCNECEEIIFSVMRHDCRTCKCGNISIDGGADYTRILAKEGAKYEYLTADLINGIIMEKSRKKKKSKRKAKK